MVVKVNKAKLIMEEVEQFDNISLEDLGEGAYHQYRTYIPCLSVIFQSFRSNHRDTLCCLTNSTIKMAGNHFPSYSSTGLLPAVRQDS